jgi:hypothetical protein
VSLSRLIEQDCLSGKRTEKEKEVKKILLGLLLVLLLATNLFAAAAGSCTATKNVISEAGITWYVLGSWAWTSHASTGAVTEVGPLTNVSGCIMQFINVPNASTTQPSDAFDLTLLDGNGVDVLMGAGANLSNSKASTAQYKTIRNLDGGPVCVHNATLTPAITNAGNSKTGTFYLILR